MTIHLGNRRSMGAGHDDTLPRQAPEGKNKVPDTFYFFAAKEPTGVFVGFVHADLVPSPSELVRYSESGDPGAEDGDSFGC